MVLAFAVVGALAGLAWWAWWKPAPLGEVIQHHPFFLPDEEFRSTGTYVAIAAPLGLVLGVLGSWRLRRDPLLMVIGVVLGGVAGGAAMLLTGWLLGPGSALDFASTARDGAVVRASLRVQPGAAWAVMPLTTAFGCLGFLLAQDLGEADEESGEFSPDPGGDPADGWGRY